MNFPAVALQVPTILLPREDVDLAAWAVIACDQYTSQPAYWEAVERLVGERPSTLRLMLPEAHLASADRPQRITAIHATMQRYLEQGVLRPCAPGFVLVNRTDSAGRTRRGLVAALDLEAYSYAPTAASLIRASEGTVLERLPPRADVRRGAALESPHVMVLIDDPERSVVEPLFDEQLPRLYDTDLMQGGGHVQGWLVDQERLWRKVAINLARLAGPEWFATRHGLADRPVLLYAMGDGNHSFATAKLVWEEIRRAGADRAALQAHPARHALVEIVNVHDEGLRFEPIHRLVSGVEPQRLLRRMQLHFQAAGCACSCQPYESLARLRAELERPHSRAMHLVPCLSAEGCALLRIDTPRSALPVGSLEGFFEAEGLRPPQLDYIHGDQVLTELAQRPGCVGFVLPPLSKHDIFRTVVLDGALPRKTFSVGGADDKRFYLECRRIA